MGTKVESTYQDDYHPPQVAYFPLPQVTFKIPPRTNLESCECKQVVQKSKVSYDWSRLGPMGFLLEPKLYAVSGETELACCGDFMKCGDTKSWMKNFEENLIVNEPTLETYDILRRIQEDRLKSTYQVDYDHLVEYPVLSYDEEILLKAEKPEIKCREPVKPPWIGGHDIPGRPRRSTGFDEPVKPLERSSRLASVSSQKVRTSRKDSSEPKLEAQKSLRSEGEIAVKHKDEARIETKGEIITPKKEELRAVKEVATRADEVRAEAGGRIDETTEIKREGFKAEVPPVEMKKPAGLPGEQSKRKKPDEEVKKNKTIVKVKAEVRVNIHKKPTQEPRVSEYADVYCFTADEIMKNKLLCTTKKCKKREN